MPTAHTFACMIAGLQVVYTETEAFPHEQSWRISCEPVVCPYSICSDPGALSSTKSDDK